MATTTDPFLSANNNANIDTYGLLYNWYAVDDSRNIAPEGWHVPSDEECKQLEMYLGMSQSEADDSSWRGTNEGSKLKATSGWINGGNGTNESGFSALPGGFRFTDGSFGDVANGGYWWSASSFGSSTAWIRSLNYSLSEIYRYTLGNSYGFSVRCLRD